ncbi:MAG: daptide-type RiPP [Actinomycetaceae bacterium]|nr:daptide-type RiPP [Actinomycetaceae bacterium]
MKNLDFSVVELEELEAPGFGEWAAGVGAGIGLGLIAVGIGAAIT